MTDSFSALQSLKFKKHVSKVHPLILKCLSYIIELKNSGSSVRMFWVKAHSGISPNEIVDKAAKRAIYSGDTRNDGVTKCDLIALEKTELYLQWNAHWRRCFTNRMTQYAHIHPTIPTQLWYEGHSIHRRFYTNITRLRVGHGLFPAHLHKLKMIDSPACPCGSPNGDMNHIFFECYRNNRQTKQFLQQLLELKITLPTDTISLLHTNRYEIYKVLYDFLRKCNINV